MRSNSDGKLVHWQVFDRGSDGRKIMRDRCLPKRKLIYHMLPWPYAKAIFDDGRLRLSQVRSWTDPYEKWWCDILFNRSSTLSGVQAYGLCWTTGTHDEPRWRMAAFCRNEPIVRIRCRADVILEAGREMIGKSSGSLFLGSVCYQREKKLRELAKHVTAGSRKEVTRTAAAMLLHKRIAFKFEQEVRLLWLDREPACDAVFVEIEPAATINQVMTSPYATQTEHRTIQAYLDKRGIESKKSALLSTPPQP